MTRTVEKCDYDELVQYSHKAKEEALGNKRGTQTQDQRHCNFLNLVLKGKLREAFCNWETGGC